MMRILIGLALLGSATWLGRRRRPVYLGAEPDGYLKLTLADFKNFAVNQFPRADGTKIDLIFPGESPLVTSPNLRMQCKELEPIFKAGLKNLAESIDLEEPGALFAKVGLSQAWAGAAIRCPNIVAPKWLLRR